ncbi:MAG: NAD(P)/FAD-dependent oxidoreductase [Rhodospirillales bacterium]
MSGATADVVIAGGAIMGASVAYFLASDPAFDGRIVVVERDPSFGRAATTRSWGGIRQQFSTPENVAMSLYGAAFLRAVPALLSTPDAPADAALVEPGYLFLASADGLAVLDENHRLQAAAGAQVLRLDRAGLATRFPWLSLDGIAGGALGVAGEGWFDPHAVLAALRRKGRALGVAYRTDAVVGVERAGGRVTGVQLAGGGAIACPTLVNAAGPWAGALAAMAGCDLPVGPRKRSTFVFDCRTPPGPTPLTIDPTGVAFRPEGAHYLAIVSPPADADPDTEDLEPDHALFDETIWPALAARVPAFAAIKVVGAWAGLYDYNVVDQNAIIGPHPGLEGFLLCNGFSGHGVQQAPAAGRAVAELIVHGRFRTLDLSALGYGRIAAGRPLRERNVV